MIYDNQIADITVTYDSYNLNTSPHKVLGVKHRELPKIVLNKYQLANTDGEIVTNTNWGEKLIEVEGRTTGDSVNDLHENLDELFVKLTNYNKNLDLTVNGSTRRYTATIKDTKVDVHDSNNCVALWSIIFTCSAYSSATSATSITYGTYTSSNTSYVKSILGSYKATPSFTLTVNTVVPYYNYLYLQLQNTTTNQLMRFTRLWSPDDVISIDGETKEVNIYATTRTTIQNMDSDFNWSAPDTNTTLSLNTNDFIEGTGCLQIDMSGTNSTLSFKRITMTAVDLSSTVGYLIIPLYMPTTTGGAYDFIRFYLTDDNTFTNYYYYDVSTQIDGSAITVDEWNYFKIDLSGTPDGSSGTPDRENIDNIMVTIHGTSSSLQASGVLLDYIVLMKPSVTSEPLDYEGSFIDYNIGNNTLVVTDEFDSRNITITGNYVKRYI